ncbi:MAG: Tyrosine recombinase XerC [Chlamydiae bacterium]|nr:Tyrosine recombinase XerC [Chlamydiota bacterium]
MPRKPKSQKKQTAQLLWWKEELGAFTFADVTPALIAQKRDELANGITCRGRQRSPSTVMRYLSALSHLLSMAVREWGWLDDSPMRKVTKLKEPRGRDRFLSKDELDRLLDACKNSSNPCLYPMVLLLVSTGMRYGEAASLTWSSVSLQQKRITLRETKNGEIRVVPLGDQVVEMLVQLEKIRRLDTLLVFPPRISAKVQKRIDIRHVWLKALQVAGVKGFRIHDLRHTAASYLTMSGASLTETAEILGHKSLSQVQRYSHLSETHKGHVIQKMNEVLLSSN